MNNIDVADVRNDLIKRLAAHGFTQAASDPTDFQQGTSRALRFKVGTQYGEVAVTAWNYSRQVGVRRVTMPDHIKVVEQWIQSLVDEMRERQAVPVEEYKP